MPNERVRTSELLQKLLKAVTLRQFIRQNGKNMDIPRFHDYITNLSREKQMPPASVIKNSGIDRTFGYQIFSGKRTPSRDKVIQLAFGFRLDYEETQELLKIARRSELYPKIQRDAVFIYALSNCLPLIDVQTALSELSLPLLGEVARDE